MIHGRLMVHGLNFSLRAQLHKDRTLVYHIHLLILSSGHILGAQYVHSLEKEGKPDTNDPDDFIWYTIVHKVLLGE